MFSLWAIFLTPWLQWITDLVSLPLCLRLQIYTDPYYLKFYRDKNPRLSLNLRNPKPFKNLCLSLNLHNHQAFQVYTLTSISVLQACQIYALALISATPSLSKIYVLISISVLQACRISILIPWSPYSKPVESISQPRPPYSKPFDLVDKTSCQYTCEPNTVR